MGKVCNLGSIGNDCVPRHFPCMFHHILLWFAMHQRSGDTRSKTERCWKKTLRLFWSLFLGTRMDLSAIPESTNDCHVVMIFLHIVISRFCQFLYPLVLCLISYTGVFLELRNQFLLQARKNPHREEPGKVIGVHLSAFWRHCGKV